MKESGCSRDLARGLGEQGCRLSLMVCEGQIAPVESWDILVTDFDMKMDLGDEFWASRVVWAGEPWPVSSIAGKIADLAAVIRGEEGSFSREHGCRTAAFFSLQGGSGVTSAAMTAGRILAGAYGETVLYLPLTYRDGSLCCRNPIGEKGCLSVRELEYRIQYGRPFSMDSFTEADQYGLEYFSVGQEWNCLWDMEQEQLHFFLKKLQESGRYSWILLDCGTGPLPQGIQIRIEVNNLQDCRIHGEQEGMEASFLIQNHGLENRAEIRENRVQCEIVHDGESFLSGADGFMDISMSKSYMEGIKIFSDLLLETVAKPADTW